MKLSAVWSFYEQFPTFNILKILLSSERSEQKNIKLQPLPTAAPQFQIEFCKIG